MKMLFIFQWFINLFVYINVCERACVRACVGMGHESHFEHKALVLYAVTIKQYSTRLKHTTQRCQIERFTRNPTDLGDL